MVKITGQLSATKVLDCLTDKFPWLGEFITSEVLSDIVFSSRPHHICRDFPTYSTEAQEFVDELYKLCGRVEMTDEEAESIPARKGLKDGNLKADRSKADAERQALLARPISNLNLSVRTRKCMIRLAINTLGDLVSQSTEDLLKCINFGWGCINEIREKLAVFGLKLKDDD